MQSEAHTPAVNVHMGQAAALPLAVRLGQFLSPLLLAAADYFAVVAAIYSAAWLRGTFLPKLFPALLPFHFGHTYIYFVIPVVYLTIYCGSRPVYQAPALLARSRAVIQGMQLCYHISHWNCIFFKNRACIANIYRCRLGAEFCLSCRKSLCSQAPPCSGRPLAKTGDYRWRRQDGRTSGRGVCC